MIMPSARPGRVPFGRSRFAAGVYSFVAILLLSPPSGAQDSTGLNDRFGRAAEAMRQGHLEEAAEGFTAITQAAPAFAEAHLNLGLVREEQGRHEEAIKSFGKALTLKPRLRGASLFLGVAEFRLNHLEKAALALKKEAAAYPKDAGAWMWLGVVQLAEEQPEEAAVSLDKAAQLDPNSIDILYHRGQAHLLVSKNSYTRMFKTDPRSWRVHQVLAQTAAEAERHLDAIVQYQEAIKLAPRQPGLHEELGSEYRNAGKFPEAETALREELTIDPHNVLARYKLGALAVERGDGNEGKKLILEAQQAKPDLLNADYNLGRAEMLLGNNENAAATLERATQVHSDFETVQQSWYQLGIVYRRLHRPEEAQKAMAIFQKLKDEQAEDVEQSMKKYTTRVQNESGAPKESTEKPE